MKNVIILGASGSLAAASSAGARMVGNIALKRIYLVNCKSMLLYMHLSIQQL